MPNFDDYIERLKHKDNEAFEYIYEQTKRGVYSVIIAIVKDRQMTEDLMQDTYIKMLKKINQYQVGRNFNAWITQIAKNTALDYYRKQQKSTLVDPIEDIDLIDREQPKENESDYSLEEMIKSLDSEERQIVLLHVVSDMKFKTIAEVVNKPLGTVLWIYQKALKKIKQSLREEPS